MLGQEFAGHPLSPVAGKTIQRLWDLQRLKPFADF